MESESWLSIVLFILLLIFSALFSGSETALFSLKAADRRKLKETLRSARSSQRVLALLKEPRRLLVSILIGNTIVNVAAATVAALFTHRVFGQTALGGWAYVIEVIAVTLALLLFSEILPKVMAVKKPLIFARRISLPLMVLIFPLRPVSLLFERLTHFMTGMLKIQKEVPFVNEEELKTLIQIGEEKGTLDKTEREMIHSIFEFRETMTKEVMVPRMDMVAVERNTPLGDVLNLVQKQGHSRIPVYQEKIDNIIGILYVKDLLSYASGRKTDVQLASLLHVPYFVPESKLIDELLREFQKERIHMAVVVDEYGGTAGLVTMEDVIEEIVGEIRDEYDREKPLIRQVKADEWLVDGKINIEELNDELGLNIPSEEDFESLGGFILSQLGAIPAEKESLEFEQYRFVVEKVVGRRIKSVRIVKEKSRDNVESVMEAS
ncbi:HlyC/CorC family transporter [bacterium]|nr:HlyC/CorC family transporter [bacterium]